MPRENLWRRVTRAFGPDLMAHRRLLAGAYLLSLMSVGFSVLSPWPLKIIIDHIVVARPLPEWLERFNPNLSLEMWAILMTLGFLLVTFGDAISGALNRMLIARVRERLGVELRSRILAHVQALPLSIQTTHKSGELVLRLVGDVNTFARLQTKTLPEIFDVLVTALLTLGIMFWMEPRLALAGVVIMPGLVLLARRYSRALTEASRNKRKREGEVAGLAQEIVRGLPTIQALGMEQSVRHRFEQINVRSRSAGVQEVRIEARMERAMKIAEGLAIGLIIGGGALLVLRGQLTVGALTVFVAYMKRLLKPVEKISEMASTVARGLASGDQLLSLLEKTPMLQDSPAAIRINRAHGILELRRVQFAYPETGSQRLPVLRDVNMKLEPGQLTVLVGESGCGKSTLLNLILRLYEPTQGTIYLDGIPHSQIAAQSLRAQMSVMLQNTHLFAGTIREALTNHGCDISDDRLWAALRLVGLDNFVSRLPKGLDTELGEDGVNLSGGQRKRISLARAFLVDRPILLLDEPLANVDAASAAVILNALDQIRIGRTCLIITHQSELMEIADVVYKLEAGRIVKMDDRNARMQPLPALPSNQSMAVVYNDDDDDGILR